VPKAGVYNFTEIVRSRFRGLAGQSMAEYSGAREQRTSGELTSATNATEEILQSYGVALKLRQKRKWHMLPNAYHDLSLRYQRSWKEHRRNQQKNASNINRRFHSPPFWVW
jgi:hypothetical protein